MKTSSDLYSFLMSVEFLNYKNGNTALHFVVKYQYEDVLPKLLQDARIDVNVRNEVCILKYKLQIEVKFCIQSGETILHHACELGFKESTNLILRCKRFTLLRDTNKVSNLGSLYLYCIYDIIL